ncbi:MAG: hypothetical protein WAK20_17105 [Candidatus Acidiferrum sp.]
MQQNHRILIGCCVAMIIALLTVGSVSHGVVRHIIQTSPLWIVVALGLRKSPLTKWTALPCFLIWLALMTLIWLFILGWAKVITGTFSPVEIAMTLIVGIACLTGIWASFRWRVGAPRFSSLVAFVLVALLQLIALRVSFLPIVPRF